jgi:hypothetical protein
VSIVPTVAASDGAGLLAKILEAVRPHVNPHSFSTWFLRIRQEYADEHRLVIRVPTRLFSKRLRDTYGDVLQTAAAEIGHPHMEFQFVLEGGSPAPPVTHGVQTPQPLKCDVALWDSAETMEQFLESGEEDAVFLDPEKRVIARSCITEIFAPRGLGKSLFAISLAVGCSRRGLRVFLIDRDNPRHVVRSRFAAFGATADLKTLKVLGRDKCPPLTNPAAWASFPYEDYDLVVLDSLDSASEGVGEQDSSKPSRALAPLLDIARHEGGPAVLILGNTIKSAQHSRGSGVIEDRADIVYEVRDATDFRPTGAKPWAEELPPCEASEWAARASRRKRRERYRLACVASKFRIGEEPEPFIVEIDLSREPWTVTDVTGEVDRVGEEAREERAQDKANRLRVAANKMMAEIGRRAESGEAALRKRQDAEPLLQKAGLKRIEARELLRDRDGRDWTLTGNSSDHRITDVLIAVRTGDVGHGSTPLEPARKLGFLLTECGHAHSMRPATFDDAGMPINTGGFDTSNVADRHTLTLRQHDEFTRDPLETARRRNFERLSEALTECAVMDPETLAPRARECTSHRCGPVKAK